jgi:hypothetical protein
MSLVIIADDLGNVTIINYQLPIIDVTIFNLMM